MAKVEGLSQLSAKLKARSDAVKVDPSVVVGFSTAYAVYVHENLEAHHPVGQAKFLEQPARTLQPELKTIIDNTMRQGQPLSRALLLAGLRLQREAQLLCPVDTGNLKGSAFTTLEVGKV